MRFTRAIASLALFFSCSSRGEPGTSLDSPARDSPDADCASRPGR
jgi:hypothetical protein